MKLTQKLLSCLHRVFDKDAAPFLVLRLRYAGAGMTWRVESATLTTAPTGGIGAPLMVDLTQYTIGELVNYLAAQPGYSVEYADRSELSLMGAAVLLDGAGDQNQSNGDHLYGYTSVLWSYMEANARELEAAAAQIDQMLLQMSTTTAGDIWLDELGGYYGVPRLQGELDGSYGPRIIAEVLRQRGNNVAIEAAISAYTGQSTTVTDVIVHTPLSPLFDAHDDFDGARFYNSTSSPLYGLFDVEYSYDLINGGQIDSFQQIVHDLIGRLRDAGTHLRSLLLKGSVLIDTVAAPTDGGALGLQPGLSLADAVAAPSESTTMAVGALPMIDAPDVSLDGLGVVVTTNYRYSGVRRFNGQAVYRGDQVSAEDVGTSGDIPFTALLLADGTRNANGAEIADGLIG
jgi:hypothetical protein